MKCILLIGCKKKNVGFILLLSYLFCQFDSISIRYLDIQNVNCKTLLLHFTQKLTGR